MLESKILAWKELLKYVNCYWLNSDNKNSMNDKKNDIQKSKKYNGATTCTYSKNVFSSKMNMATTGPEQKQQFKVQPRIKSRDIAG